MTSGEHERTPNATGPAENAEIGKASPPTPEQTIDSVKADVAEIKERAQR
jgi:hypothetical protein